MASAPLNWLIKVGGAALKVGSTLSEAVNTLYDTVVSHTDELELTSNRLSSFNSALNELDGRKVDTSDVLSSEEIEASTELSRHKVAAAESVKALKDALTWNYVGNVTGKSKAITLPTDWRELKILVIPNGETLRVEPIEFIRDMLNYGNAAMAYGGGASNTAGTGLFRGRITITAEAVALMTAYSGAPETPVDITTNATVHVWYR